MPTVCEQPKRDVAGVLSLPPGEKRNAGLQELACQYQSHLELYISCELQTTRWNQYFDPQDLVQSLYLKLLTVEVQEQIRDEKHLLNWLQCVLRNHMLEKAKALKARKRDVSRVTQLPDDASTDAGLPLVGDDRRPNVSPRCAAPPLEATRNEDVRRFRRFLHEVEAFLDADDWDLFRRHHLEGIPQALLAIERNRTPGAVCQRLKRIWAALAGRFPHYADLLEG
jgi:RNA polymerase sigma factor (sigma-70 family)